MDETGYKVCGYRWIVLFVFCVMQAVMQMLWITFAPVIFQYAAEISYPSPEASSQGLLMVDAVEGQD